ncbi:MAG TPA: 30S ribosomal protein S6 [Candidatus Omnitrophota bacterium]|nr:30S ribosomal protein S6 [Candidatus Omnitrophota bacterium]
MKKYEGLFIFPPEVSGESHKDPIAEVTKWIEKFQGKVLQKNDLGKKTLGHPLRKHKEGRVLVFEFEMDTSKTQDFRKELELQSNLLKYMISIPCKKVVLPALQAATAVSKE